MSTHAEIDQMFSFLEKKNRAKDTILIAVLLVIQCLLMMFVYLKSPD